MSRSRTWLLKTEPSEYSFDDLERDGVATWDGVTNPLALQHLREIEAGDEIVVYHTGRERAAVGLARVIRGAYPDSRREDGRYVVVDLEPASRFAHPVSLAKIQADPLLSGIDLVRLPRLSVMPIAPAHRTRLLALGAGQR
ncbi:MAG: EVE domain-containing protein [Acidobacteriota bacterium]